MENINDLLEKYFKAETTLAEENKLKQHFASQELAPEHACYKYLFVNFIDESKVTAPKPPQIILAKKVPTMKYLIQILSISGIAAVLLLSFWIIRPTLENDTKNNTKNFALSTNNQNIDNEYAKKYVDEKFKKVNDILSKSLKPLDNLEKVKNGMKPINKISKTRDKINEFQNKVQY